MRSGQTCLVPQRDLRVGVGRRLGCRGKRQVHLVQAVHAVYPVHGFEHGSRDPLT